MSAAPAVTAANFEEEVLKSAIPVLVDFWAEWCGPCKALGPTIDLIAAEYEGKAKILKLDVQTEAALAGKYGVQSIPTLLIFKDGEIKSRLVGLHPKPDITAEIDKQL
ncbi:MAG: thioredoxin [Armatimonadetes bacterium]|nr:thioredoxin [Armatimonadota bacterium]